MNTLQLQQILNDDPWVSNGYVCSIDKLPQSITDYPLSLIINTDESDQPGEHWIAVYIVSPKEAEFFDSYGHEPCYMDDRLCHFLSNYNVLYNSQPFQGPLSVVCGHYCVLFILHRSRGVSFYDILHVLNSVNSDDLVEHNLSKFHI